MSASPREAPARLVGLGLGTPERSYTQEELCRHRGWEDESLAARLFLRSAVRRRGFHVRPQWYDEPRDLDQTNAAWLEGCLELGGRALRGALAAAGCAAEELDLLAVTTVTGYATPGLDLLLARQEGLRQDFQRAHLNCMGCHAALPTLRLAADHARVRPGATAAALAVEVCSACFADDEEPQNLVSASLFADGAAACIVSTEGAGPRIVDFASANDFEHLPALGFDLTTSGFRIVLDRAVPRVIGEQVAPAVDALLARHGLGRGDVSAWCLHPGGERVLDAAADALALRPDQTAASRRVLAERGNMSSPSVLFVLDEALRTTPDAGAPGSVALLVAFGPGLGIELGLLAFD